MRIIEDVKLDFADVLIVPKNSELKSRSEVTLVREFSLLHSGKKFSRFGIIAANMDSIGTFSMAKAMDEHAMMTALHKHHTLDKLSSFYGIDSEARGVALNSCWYTMGTSDADLNKFYDFYIENKNTLPDGPPFVCIDIANGYSEHLVSFVENFRGEHPKIALMVGNVVTPEMTELLVKAGADIVKVGIGPGSVCTTRKMTGVGYPQLSAIIECADAAHGKKAHICADGGCTTPGDIAKAFGAGADFVMLGGMLAGHDECEGKIIGDPLLGEERKMQFYGMSSDTAMNKYNGGIADYRTSEGKTVLVPYRGSVFKTLKEIEGGVRSACTYTGSHTVKELHRRTTFIRVNRQLNNVFN